MPPRRYATLQETRWKYILSTLERVEWDIRKASNLLKVSEKFIKKELASMSCGRSRPRRKG